jgi:hypothetical protein
MTNTVSLISTTTRFNTTMAQYSSSRQSSTAAAAAAAAKPFCKVCKDAGKPESEYTSHFVKDIPGPKGKVVCPTLLSQACRICNETGHTSSYCSKYRPHRDNRDNRDNREVYYPRDRVDNRENREVYYPLESERPRDRVDNRENREVYYPRDRGDISFNRLHEDTERRERDIYDRDVQYYREKDRQTKPWLQAAIKPIQHYSSSHSSRRAPAAPYAHPHGPRVRLELESRALSAAAVPAAAAASPAAAAAIDVMKVDLGHSTLWGDEDNGAEMIFQEFVNFVNSDDNDSKEEERFREIRADDDEDTLLTMSVSSGGNCFSSACD